MLNNKGQSLILFVLFIPVILLLLVLVIDIGKIISLKNELDSINNIVIDYGLDNLDKEELDKELINLIKLNKSDIDDVEVKVENEKIIVRINDNDVDVFFGLIDISFVSIDSSYEGYIEDNQKRIKRIVGD